MELDLDIESAIRKVNENRPKNILLQLPDGLKPKAEHIIDNIIKKTNLDRQDIVIWGGSCYGACDTPEIKGFDMLIQFGHSRWCK